jgi:hypothetical protein
MEICAEGHKENKKLGRKYLLKEINKMDDTIRKEKEKKENVKEPEPVKYGVRR